VLVGECPGPDENKAGKPFIGRAGKTLRHILDSIGIDTDKIYITNIVKCFPYTKENPTLNPTKEQVQTCSPYLEQRLKLIEPKLVVTLGRFSSEYFLGALKITKETGKLRKINRPYHILPVVHPSYVVRGNKTINDYVLELLPMLEFYNGG